MEYWAEVLQAIPTEDYQVYIYFDDGTIRLFDARKLLTEGRFSELLEGNLFVDACTVLNSTLAWTLDGSYSEETCLDLDPYELYENCPVVDEPHWLFPNYEH